MLTSMKYEAGSLYLIDQRELPHKEIWLEYNHEQAVADAIVDMVVRGAPAIGCAAAFGVSIGVRRLSHECRGSLPIEAIDQIFSTLQHTRPTAVNLFYALKKMRDTYESHKKLSNEAIVSALEKRAIALFDDDLRTCRLIGKHGADFLGRQYDQLNGLTHCNAGSLATAGYGTALSVFTELFRRGRLGHVFVDETRPWLQGARLTAFEMARAGVPYSIICDSAAAHFMAIQSPKINVVVVGADRIAANGDAANKIGTYSLAIAAKHHGIGFLWRLPSLLLMST